MSGLRVLIVDDEQQPREFLEDLVEGRGHRFDSADSVEQALSLLEKNRYDLCVQDLCLPLRKGRLAREEHGFELVRKAREALPKAFLIVLTGKGTGANEASDAYELGCNAYVLKGDRDRLLGKLELAESQAKGSSPKGKSSDLPLAAKLWKDCSLVFGEQRVVARTRSRRAVVQPSEKVLGALYQLLWAGEEGSDLRSLARTDDRRRSLARDVREFLRKTFDVAEGASDGKPIVHERARKTWISLVVLRDEQSEADRSELETLRRREYFDAE